MGERMKWMTKRDDQTKVTVEGGNDFKLCEREERFEHGG